MKQYFTYGLLLALALLTHSVGSRTTGKSDKGVPPVYRQEQCFVSEEHPDHSLFQHLYHCYSTQACDISHADMTHDSTDKNPELLLSGFRGYDTFAVPAASHIPHAHPYFRHPNNHYIYGLRKIVV
ncbi:hypothetical protein [Bacteroides pyogenes]|uniref:Uncharacterized protein n=1 Tax=Bacteroides pyogenes TaxID=310300 RepID=A0A5D3EAK0_9BACE|nr:hypothetical protein [Bacteroides pyogenes]TYK32982.1 hypothetical protein FNJ60_09855 [Bacteroides pyogenes]TYK47433.1 hypothetical protein FNG97_09310 [Bacteroides pyogenes]